MQCMGSGNVFQASHWQDYQGNMMDPFESGNDQIVPAQAVSVPGVRIIEFVSRHRLCYRRRDEDPDSGRVGGIVKTRSSPLAAPH